MREVFVAMNTKFDSLLVSQALEHEKALSANIKMVDDEAITAPRKEIMVCINWSFLSLVFSILMEGKIQRAKFVTGANSLTSIWIENASH